jgi:hypothetical protein
VVIRKPRFAIFHTREPEYATPPSFHTDRNQTFSGEKRREASRSSLGLRFTSQQLWQGVAPKTYVDLALLVSSQSGDVHDPFPSAGLPNNNPDGWKSYRDMEMIAGQWRGMMRQRWGMVRRLDDGVALGQVIWDRDSYSVNRCTNPNPIKVIVASLPHPLFYFGPSALLFPAPTVTNVVIT